MSSYLWKAKQKD